ncbi:hypothetical protein Droror1_Dr00020384 [Drosera rotundifolia]
MEVESGSIAIVEVDVERKHGGDDGGLGEEDSGGACEGRKMRDLESVMQVEGMDTHYPNLLKLVDGKVQLVSDVNASGAMESDLTDRNRSGREFVNCSHKLIDLNSEASPEENTASNDHILCSIIGEKESSKANGGGYGDKGRTMMAGFDLNAEDVSSSAINDPFHPYTFQRQLKQRDVLECGSTTGSAEEKDPIKKWKEMKENGFVSPSYYGGIPAPKQRGRKPKNDANKKRLEQAKKDQVDRFMKLAAPTGLLSSLNPGIINHVRNRKQVHSIIKSLLVSKEKENRQDMIKQMGIVRGRDGEAGDRGKELKWRNTYTENGSVSSGAINGVDSLSVKAANVASQWLQLLHQDIKSKLAELRCSRKRIQDVITTEMPLMLANEFSRNQERETAVARGFAPGNSHKRVAALHQSYWANLFNKMDRELNEEEHKLDCWLNEVEKMKAHCEFGLREVQCHSGFGLHQSGAETYPRSGKDEAEQLKAVQAAAASLYSTCNFLLSKEMWLATS